MPSDDREQQFERGLARHLRGGSADGACPDAEILAAYHGRTLAPEELEQWKKHIAGCGRCQETLALMESSEIVLEEQREKDAVAHLQPVSALLRAEMASAPLGQQEAARSASVVAMKAAGNVNSAAGKKSKMLRWAAPLGAIAAVLILWVSWRHSGNPAMQAPAQNAVQVAENRESQQDVSQNEPKGADEGRAAALTGRKTVPPEDDGARGKNSAPKPVPPMIMPPIVNGPRRSAGAYAQSDNSLAQDRLDKQVASEAAQGKLMRPMTLSKKSEGVGYGSGAGVAPGGAMPATAAPAAPPETTGVAVNASAANAKVDANVTSADAAKPAATARAKDNKTKEEVPQSVTQAAAAAPSVDTSSPSQAPSVASKQVSSLNARNYTESLTLAPGVAGGNVITSPKGKQAWRAGKAGLIEHTGDGGKTWTAQKSGVTTDLVSGTAASDKICWVVGKVGTLLLTSDGGKHWKVLGTPLGEDLARVQASDEQHAKIWSAGDKAAYVTDNGGLSWAPAGENK